MLAFFMYYLFIYQRSSRNELSLGEKEGFTISKYTTQIKRKGGNRSVLRTIPAIQICIPCVFLLLRTQHICVYFLCKIYIFQYFLFDYFYKTVDLVANICYTFLELIEKVQVLSPIIFQGV